MSSLSTPVVYIPLLTVLIAIATLCGSAQGWSEEKKGPAPKGLAALSWLAGAWHNDTFETVYTTPRGGEIVSASKFIQQEKAVFFDFERFFQKGDEVVMTPFPGGAKSVAFVLTGFDPQVNSARFVNEAHDFPKTLTYERTGEKTLRITLTGEEDGKARKMVLELKRS